MSLKRNALWGTAASNGTHHVTSKVPSSSNALDCTPECRAREHSSLVLSSACLGNLKLLKHCATVCANPVRIQDALGRNALHVAASKGYLQLVLWLVARKKVKMDIVDLESRWTALHRSAYYGQLGAAAILMKHGADVDALDYDGWSPLAILNADRQTLLGSLDIAAVNVHTWGSNPNDTLGHDRTRKHPEKLDLTLSPTDYVTKVVLCKFHSVFLTLEGHVLSCGHGPGGRLGHDSEQSIVTPRIVKAVEGTFCTGIAAARDHTVILTRSGAVYTCGLNDAHQLGHGSNPATAPSNYLAPKLVRGLKSKHVIAVGTGRYHTAMCSETELYTVGKNLGQLGYGKNYETQVAPHAVAGVSLDHDIITHMSVSDSATAVLTRKHHVFVCTNFTVKHIRFGFLDKASCLQFEVCASLSDRDYLRKEETEPTKLLVLDSEHRLWVWEPTKRGSFPSLFSGFAKRNVSHFSLGKSLTFVTKDGEVYKGNGSVNKPLNLQRVPYIQNACAVFTDFKANNLAYTQNVFRSPFLPAKSHGTLTSDLSSLLEESSFPGSVSDITIEVGDQQFSAHKFMLHSQTHDFASQLITSECLAHSGLPESSFKLRKKCDDPVVFDAFLHYIYGSHIRLLPSADATGDLPVSNGDGTEATNNLLDWVEGTPDTSFVSLDENDLTDEYDQYCVDIQTQDDLLVEDRDMHSIAVIQSTPRKKSHSMRSESSMVEHASDTWREPEKVIQLSERRVEIKSLLLLATSFDLTGMKKALEDVLPQVHKRWTITRPQMKLKRPQEFSDLTLISTEGKAIQCHKCVLVARSEYFRSMLLMGWKESLDDSTSLKMSVGYKVLEAVIDFIYTDELPAASKETETAEWMMSVLVMADQLLLTRLKELCELSLATILDLRNAVDFLEFAETYSAYQLKKSCLQFICVNISYFLEARTLDDLDVSLLEELSNSYQELFLLSTKRVIKFPEPLFELIPQSYFSDNKLHDDELEPGASSASEDDTMHGGTADVADTSSLTTTTISPRATSNSRRKRKRKNSQSEKRHSTPSKSPSPVPPVQVEGGLRANPSPPIPASPDSIISPCSPISALASECTPRSLADISAESDRSTKTPKSSSNSPSPAPWINIEKKRNVCNSRSKVGRVDSIGEEEEAVSRASSVPHQGKNPGQPVPTTPLSAPRKVPSHAKKTGEMRTRLMNKFNAMTIDMDSPESRQTAKDKQQSPPARIESIASGPWACINTGAPAGGKNLRDIMAKEEEIQRRNRKVKVQSPPPLSLGSGFLFSSGQDNPLSGAKFSAKSQPIPVVRNSPSDVATVSSSPASANPWGTPESPSPAIVSMRDLIAEAEAEDKHVNASMIKPRPMKKVLEEKPVKRQPAVPPHQQVSFASIIKSQESERNDNRSMPNKTLSLIQIEERAISELETAYLAAENPDEFITVKRCSKGSHQPDRTPVPRNSPWSRES